MTNLTHRRSMYQGNVERYRQEKNEIAQAWTLTVISGLLALILTVSFFASLML